MNKKLIIVALVVVVIVALGVWLAVSLTASGSGSSEYSAVYLTSGDIYFGKLTWFPHPRLTSVWLLQRTVGEQNQPQLGVAPFTSAFWGPIDEIRLNPKEVIFWTRLRLDSELARAFRNPASVQPPPPQTP